MGAIGAGRAGMEPLARAMPVRTRVSVPGGHLGEAAEDRPDRRRDREVEADLTRQELGRVGHHDQPVADHEQGDGARRRPRPAASASPWRRSSAMSARAPRARAAAAAPTSTSPTTSGDAGEVVESQPLALVAEKGGPRLVAYQGRKTATTSTTPERTPTNGGRDAARVRHAWPAAAAGDRRGGHGATVPPVGAGRAAASLAGRVPTARTSSSSARPSAARRRSASTCATTRGSSCRRPKEPHYFCDDFDYYYAPGERTEEHYLRLFDERRRRPPGRGRGVGLVPLLGHRGAQHRGVRPGDAGDRDGAQPGGAGRPRSTRSCGTCSTRTSPTRAPPGTSRSRAPRGEHLPPTVRVPGVPPVRRRGDRSARSWRASTSPSRASSVKVLVFDDLRADTGAVYRDALAFLGVPDDGRSEFPRVNENKVHERPRPSPRFTQRPPAPPCVARGVKRVPASSASACSTAAPHQPPGDPARGDLGRTSRRSCASTSATTSPCSGSCSAATWAPGRGSRDPAADRPAGPGGTLGPPGFRGSEGVHQRADLHPAQHAQPPRGGHAQGEPAASARRSTPRSSRWAPRSSSSGRCSVRTTS